jgi:outer membrane lipoprotein-sorting protein
MVMSPTATCLDLHRDAPVRMLDHEIKDRRAWTRDTVSAADWTVRLTDRALGEVKALADVVAHQPLPVLMLSPDQFELPACREVMAKVRTILRDGDNFYIYNPKIHRVEEYYLGKKKSVVDQFLLLGFGTSGSSLKESYTITLQGEETLDNHKVLRLELLPKTDEVRKQLSKIQLWLDETSWLSVQQQFFETGSGDYFIIRYRNINRNVRIPDNEFKAHWPRGTTKVQPQA